MGKQNQTQKKRNIIWRVYKLIFSCVVWFYCLIFTFCWAFTAMCFGIMGFPRVVHWVGISWGKLLFYTTGCRLHVDNREKIFKNGPVIFVCNHQSLFDILTMYVVLKDVQFRWMAKASLFKIPILGWAMSGSGYIPVDRRNRKKALKSLFMAAKSIQGGSSILIFPESTRSTLPHGQMLPFKKGAFIMAKKAKVVIQPITIWGAQRVVPKSADVKIQRIYPGLLKAIIHDPIMPDDYKDLNAAELSNKLRQIIEEPMARLLEELPM